MVHLSIAGDLVHPGGEGVFGVVCVAVAEDAEVDFLDEVLTEFTVAGATEKEVEQGAVVAFEQHREFAQVPVANLLHQN
jgi:hypothetical protein